MRRVLHLTGKDVQHFLQNLVSNDVSHLDRGPAYAALLTPQGKYLADFFVTAAPDGVFLDCAEALAAPLAQRLMMYRLRADVQIGESALKVSRGVGPAPAGAAADPRHPTLGWRLIAADDHGDIADFDARRVAAAVPESGVELIPNASYILEMGFDRLNGVDFRKGCYVGQEVTARMHHKTVLKRGLVRVAIDGAAPVGSDILAGDKVVGQIFTQVAGQGLALLLHDTGDVTLHSAGCVVTRL